MVHTLNKRIPSPLRLVPAHIRMDLDLEKPSLPRRATEKSEKTAALARMDREVHKGAASCFDERKADYLAGATRTLETGQSVIPD